MAQVIVNFRMDEDVKKNMEQACKEMGLSMTAAFTIFAKKVGNEKRIPFEITAQPQGLESHVQRSGGDARQEERRHALSQRRERLERLCTEVRRSLTSLHIAIPASITGLPMERIRLLCRDELKDKAAGVSKDCKALFSGRGENKDLSILDEYADGLSAIAEELLELERTMIPAMKACPTGDSGEFEPYARRLAEVSRSFDALAPIMQRFLQSTACGGAAQGLRTRLRQAAAPMKTPYVLTALEHLDGLILRRGGALEEKTAARLEADYLPVLELTLEELAQAEQEGGDVGEKGALCLRVVNVLTQVISDGGQVQQELSRRRLEAEVEALERVAAMRGDIEGGIRPKE